MRWSELRAALPSGLCDEAVEAIRAATAEARAEERARQAIVAAVTVVGGDPDLVLEALYALRHYDLSDEARAERVAPVRALMRAAGALCAVEATAGGGRYRVSGPAPTCRAPWARALGKGRRQASDGDAWTAAIAQAGASLLVAAGGGTVPSSEDVAAIPPGVDDDGVRAYARHQIWITARRVADHAAAAPLYLGWSGILSRWADPPPTLRELAAEGRLTISAIITQKG